VCANEDELAGHAKWIELLGDECLWAIEKKQTDQN